MVSGTVFDSTKSIPVRNVLVRSTGGTTSFTDTAGRYSILLNEKDSISFFYNNKSTQLFPVAAINNPAAFDISLHVRVSEKFKTLKEVRIFTKTYREDSIENRRRYAGIFNYQKPGFSSTTSSYTGAAGMDLDEFINIFRFKRNRQNRYMQKRLLEQEEDKFINYRFNKPLVKRITRLEGKQLDEFMQLYRPDIEFTQNSTTVDFYQYILDASYKYRQYLLIQRGR